MVYHDIKHTLNVERSAERIASLEGVEGEELIILKTAVLFHDAGFIFTYDKNEELAIKLIQKELPNFGYTDKQIEEITKIIQSTQF